MLGTRFGEEFDEEFLNNKNPNIASIIPHNEIKTPKIIVVSHLSYKYLFLIESLL